MSSVKNTIRDGAGRFARKIPAAVQMAGASVGLAILDDAVNEEPTPPIDTGLLRGSGFVYSAGRLVKAGPRAAVASSFPAGGKGYEIVVGFNTPYAKYQHEGLQPGPGVETSSGRKINLQPGPKSQQAGNVGGRFLFAKIEKNKDKYAAIFADRLGRNTGMR
jgi:hypothetical protein